MPKFHRFSIQQYHSNTCNFSTFEVKIFKLSQKLPQIVGNNMIHNSFGSTIPIERCCPKTLPPPLILLILQICGQQWSNLLLSPNKWVFCHFMGAPCTHIFHFVDWDNFLSHYYALFFKMAAKIPSCYPILW